MFEQTKTRLLGATMLAGLLGAVAPAAMAATTATVPGNVAGWVAHAVQTGAAADSQTVTIAVHMALKDVDGLKAFVAAVSNPKSSQYGQYITPAAFRLRFAPDDADVATVKALLTQAGMTDIRVGISNSYVSAKATVAQLRTTFGITQNVYKYGNLTLRANSQAPTVPGSLAGKIIDIEGLDDTTFLKQPHHISVYQGKLVAPAGFKAEATPLSATPAVTPPPVASNDPSPYCDSYIGDLEAVLSTKPDVYGKKQPWIGCGYTPQQVQQAYGLNRVHGLDGTGVKVAIIDAYASPTIKADANQYATNHSLPQLTSANFSETYPQGELNIDPSTTADCGGEYGWWGEESLDVASVHGNAPGATIRYVGAADCGTSLTTALTDVIYADNVDIATNSYGYNGEGTSAAQNASDDQTFMAADAEGMTVLFSTGDEGDLSQINGLATGSQEADSPYVTGVGGTSLALVNSNGRKYEFGWGTFRIHYANATVNSGTSVTESGFLTTTAFGYTFDSSLYTYGSGGGISPSEVQPDYQASVVPTALATTLNTAGGGPFTTSQPQRVSPDVSMLADPYLGYLIGESFTTAGDPINDAGCTKKTSTTEYCEIPYGGTSLATPSMAAVIAVVDQQRMRKHKPLVGFANPWFYGAKIGTSTALDAAGINDVTPPTTPFGLLRAFKAIPGDIETITLNSTPFLIYTTPFAVFACQYTVCEGINDLFNYTTAGYDDVTGLGVPWAPYLINQ